MNFLTRLSKDLVAWVIPRPRFILMAALLTVIASIWISAVRLEVRTAQLELVSRRLPLIAKTDMLDKFEYQGKSTFTLVVRAPTQDRAIEFIKGIVAKIQADPQHFKGVFYRIDPDEYKKWLLYYLDKDELARVRDTMEQNSQLVSNLAEDPDLFNFFRLVNRDMSSRMVGELFTGFLDDGQTREGQGKKKEPMDLEFLIKVLSGLDRYLSGTPKYVSPWSSFFKSGVWDLEKEGYLWEDKKMFLIAVVVPAKVSGQVSTTQSSLAKLRADIERVRAAGFNDVQAGVTGQQALNDDEISTSMADMTKAAWVSLLGVILIMVVFLRGFRHPLIIAVSLAVALCWTFGWTTIFIGHLNVLSIVFAPMLCGLGSDYAIHWFARYEEERDLSGGSRSEIIKRVVDKSGTGIVLAGLATAVSFFSFILTGFRGLMELGMITGMGILFIILADFTVLPALSYYLAAEKGSFSKSAKRVRNRYLIFLSPTGVRAVLAAALVLSAVGSIMASHVQFDLNPLRLQARNSESVYWEKVLVENSTKSIISAALITLSPEKVMKESAKFKTLPTVSDVDTVFTLLPGDQEEKAPVLRNIARMIPELKSSVAGAAPGGGQGGEDPPCNAALIDVLERINFKMQPEQASKWGASRPQVEQMVKVREFIDRILQPLKNSPSAFERLSEYRNRFNKDLKDLWTLIRESSSAPPMSVQDIPTQLRDQFLHGGRYLIRIYPKEPIWNEGALNRFVKAIQSVNPDVVGDPVSLYVFASAYKRASIQASVFALIAVSLLLAFIFRSWPLMLISLTPLVAGTIWTVGIMQPAGIDFNLANSIFMPLVVGAGVEYGVIIVQRWREGRAGKGRLPFSTGKGVILAALTTTIGFGTLMISNNMGIFSLGFVAWEGSICVLAAALMILTAILSFMPEPARAVDEEPRNGD